MLPTMPTNPTNEVDYWQETLKSRAKELGLSGEVKPVQPGIGEGFAIHWVYAADDQLVELGWNVEEAERNLRMLAVQMQING